MAGPGEVVGQPVLDRLVEQDDGELLRDLTLGPTLDPDEVEVRCPDWILVPDGLRQT